MKIRPLVKAFVSPRRTLPLHRTKEIHASYPNEKMVYYADRVAFVARLPIILVRTVLSRGGGGGGVASVGSLSTVAFLVGST